MVVVNCLDVSKIDNTYYRLLRETVSKERQIKADNYYFSNDAKHCICAEVLLKYCLNQENEHLEKINIGYNKFGKPYVNNVKDFSFNLSHSEKWVVIAYAKDEVGIDIEKKQSNIVKISDRVFTQNERSYIVGEIQEEQDRRFMEIWTLKESYVKYLGTGLSTNLKSFSVNTIEGTVTNYKGIVEKNIVLKSYLFDNEYCLAVCSKEEQVSIKFLI